MRKKNDFVVHFQLGERRREALKGIKISFYSQKKNPMMAQLVPIIFTNNNVNTHHLHSLSLFPEENF